MTPEIKAVLFFIIFIMGHTFLYRLFMKIILPRFGVKT
jgi:hypothetical protein